jgi:GrpB-like predicted nucleotidyltransferase (UPF0157 family)
MPSALEQRAISEPVRLVAYDASWAELFRTERTRLIGLFAQFREIEHIGSTAVPGMPAKPIVDMLAGVDSMSVADVLFDPILQAGYTTSRAFNDMLPDRRWFMLAEAGRRTHHLHVVVWGSPTWLKHLRFRDRLRSNVELAQEYAQLKARLAVQFEHDREAYTDAKSEFVAAVLAGA